MGSFSSFGNDLYTGTKSFNIVARGKTWFLVSALILLVAIGGTLLRGGFTFGIEFTGGSQFQLSAPSTPETEPAVDAVQSVLPESAPKVTLLGQSSVRVQTEQVTDTESRDIRAALAAAYNVEESAVTSSFIGAAWGQDITRQALIALAVFLVFVSLVMAIYFRTWKMSVAAIVALLHDLVITAGIYGITGLEITPAAMIGFLTILGYSLYDTVVVFDKVRENTEKGALREDRTFAQAVNLSVNQTLVRSINTSVVALLPVASILFIGAFALGAGTLRDISLALFIGLFFGVYSTIFVAAPLYSMLRSREPSIRKHDERARAIQSRSAEQSASVQAVP